jgi:hypothetical protein
MSIYATYRLYDIEKKVLPTDFINLIPKLWLLTLTIERSDGTFVDGLFCNDQFVIWRESLNSWLIPVKYNVYGEYRRKYILIDDLVLSGVSLYEIAILKEILNNGIYKSFVLGNFHHISPQFGAMQAPQVTRENKMYIDFTRRTPELNPENVLDVPEPLFL